MKMEMIMKMNGYLLFRYINNKYKVLGLLCDYD